MVLGGPNFPDGLAFLHAVRRAAASGAGQLEGGAACNDASRGGGGGA